MSLGFCCRIARSIRPCAWPTLYAKPFATTDSCGTDGALAVGVSIGIAEITAETRSVADVMSAADVACYAAKDQGRNRVQLYKPDDVPERHREMHWVSKLTRACDQSRFELFYQPIVAHRLEPLRA